MTRKALVIGAQTGVLTGVDNDAAAMTTLLSARGFEVDCRTGKDATQDGIREGYEKLIGDTREGDATVMYFSGHGGLAQVKTPGGNWLPDLRFIVPSDYDSSTPGDFRGITAVEMSVLLARLTERTHNATVILDCCHAAHMVRNDDLRVKARPYPTYLDIGEHIGMLRAAGLQIDLPHVETNPWAVRLVACAPWESAYEYTNKQGMPMGILTDSLRVCLDQAGPARVPWSVLIQRVRSRVSALALGQRPEVAGPSRRLLFDTEEARAGVALTVVHASPDRLTLPGAALLGVAPGDQFAITPTGAVAATEATTVARATVTRTDGMTVLATFELCAGYEALPPLVEAHPVVVAAVRDQVLVRGDGALAAPVRAAVDAAPGLRAVAEAEPGRDPLLAEVEVGDSISLWDGGSEPLVSAPATEEGSGQVVDVLRRLGRTAALRRLTPGAGEALTEPFTVEWGRVVDGVPEPLPASGALLHVDEPIYLRLRNNSERNLFFFVFDLGVAGAATLITAADPSGLRLSPRQEYILGERDRGALEGSPMVWPAGVPTADPRPESLLVIVSTEAQDLSVLSHDGVRTVAAGDPSPVATALADAVDHAATREWHVPAESAARFAVVRLDCTLSPAPAPARRTRRFLVDDRPVRSLRPRALTPAGGPPGAVAVRLTDLVVRRNRAFRDADIRVDTLVLTGGTGALPAYRAETVRFSNVRDGDRLPMDNLLAYHGPAVDYLDIAWWVSRDRRDSLALTDLLRDRLTDESVQHAIGSLSAIAVGGQHAALAVSAVGACAIIVAAAYDLLSTMVGDSIGLYRTSLLANENFGVGRHPTHGTRSAQDFSFAYEVVAVG